jgi:biofilm PGA synthesis N-glycosyltransferase PgaC
VQSAPAESYVLISPVKDEEKFIEKTIESVCQQTVRPLKWIIVDDGSRDRTSEIIADACRDHNWITSLKIDRGALRSLGSTEVRAFAAGYREVEDQHYDFVVKLDGDLELPRDYFEHLLNRFRHDQTLGIASGVYLENTTGNWKPIRMPAYHAAGAAKMLRAACFNDIGGFALFPGWDTADEIKAWSKGWKTQHFPEIQFRHLKPEGSMQGLAMHIKHGEIFYVCGGGPLFLLFKVLDRMVSGKPLFLGGLLLLCGYLRAAIKGHHRLVSHQEAAVYRHLLNQRITAQLAKCCRQ